VDLLSVKHPSVTVVVRWRLLYIDQCWFHLPCSIVFQDTDIHFLLSTYSPLHTSHTEDFHLQGNLYNLNVRSNWQLEFVSPAEVTSIATPNSYDCSTEFEELMVSPMGMHASSPMCVHCSVLLQS
jgi:hypothetical protein